MKDPHDAPSSPDVAVIIYSFWLRRFRRDDAVVGRTVTLNGVAFAITGVAAPEFFGERVSRPPDFWIPLSVQPRVLRRGSWVDQRDEYRLNMMGRLKPGITARAAAAVLNAQLHRFYIDHAGSHLSPKTRREIQNVHITLKPGGGGISGLRYRYSEPLHALMAVVAVVLCIASANIATLLLARASARNREFLSRLALGASKGRVFRQVLTESLLLAAFGAIAGIGLAWVSVKMLTSAMRVGSVVAAKPDLAILAFTVGLSIASGVAFGLVPALKCSRLDLRAGFTRTRRFDAASVLIVIQVALSLVLLLGSGLLAHSLVEMVGQDLGYKRQNVVVVRTDPRFAGYSQAELFSLYRELDERLNAVPGVISPDVPRFSPASGNMSSCSFSIQGFTPSAGEEMRVYKVEVGRTFSGR